MGNKYTKRFKKSKSDIVEIKNKRKSLMIIIPIILIVLTTIVGYASTKEVIVKHERLDTGVVFVWADGNGNWQNGLYPNGSCNRNEKINIGKADFRNFQCEVYNGLNFGFGSEETSHWNITAKCKNKDSYNRNYLDYCTNFNSGSVSYDKSTGNLTMKESVTLTSNMVFNVADYVRNGDQQTIYDYLGDTPPSSITTPMNKMLTDPNVQGYLYFCPMVITYDEVTLVPFAGVFLKAGIDMPEKIKVGESFTIKDTSVLEGDTLDHTELHMNTGDGWQQVTEWDGSKLGSEIEVMTRRDPDRAGYCELSYDGGKSWVDGCELNTNGYLTSTE